jgi:hypothetical protein
MDKWSLLALAFLFGLPLAAGKVRASNVEAENNIASPAPSYMMDMSYKEALEDGEVTNCFSWEEQYTMYEIKAYPVK